MAVDLLAQGCHRLPVTTRGGARIRSLVMPKAKKLFAAAFRKRFYEEFWHPRFLEMGRTGDELQLFFGGEFGGGFGGGFGGRLNGGFGRGCGNTFDHGFGGAFQAEPAYV